MNDETKKEKDQRLFYETAQRLSSQDSKDVINQIHHLHSSWNVKFMPLVLDLLLKSTSKTIIAEVLSFIGQLKDQKSVEIIVQYINHEKAGNHLAELISECWQSGLDYSGYLIIFADCFISGDYQVALESFTVIEEMLWISTPEMIDNCRQYLLDQKDKVNKEKDLLFQELIKTIDQGISQSAKDYPEIFEN